MKLKDGDLLTVGDAAEVMGVTSRAVIKMEIAARLPLAARTVGGVRLFWAKDVQAMKAKREKARARLSARKAAL